MKLPQCLTEVKKMQQILDEIAEKIENLSDEELDKLSAIVNERKKSNEKSKGYVSPDTIWVKEHHAEYAGNYVASEKRRTHRLRQNHQRSRH